MNVSMNNYLFHSNVPKRCLFNGNLFLIVFISQTHMKWHESHPGFICPICYYQLEDNTSYKEHVKLHKDKNPFACVFCEKSYNHKESVRAHVEIIVSVRD